MILLHGNGAGAREMTLGGGWAAQEGEKALCRAALELPEYGVYKITGEVKNARALFGVRRNALSLAMSAPFSGEFSYYVHTAPYIPPMTARALEDRRAYLSAADGEIADMRYEKADARTVFLAGDSTVADQMARAPYDPNRSYAGWGQMLSLFLREFAVCNQAHSGLTSRGFVQDGHFELIRGIMREGDLFLIQFGHNDQKRRALQADAEYPAWLTHLVDGARAMGATPVLLTPASRVPARDADGWYEVLGAHAQTVLSLGAMLGVPVIDLHAYTLDLYKQLGDECLKYFVPGDRTHTNDYGAYKLARFVSDALGALGLAKPILPEAEFDTDRTVAPCAPENGPEIEPPFVDMAGKDERAVRRAMNMGLLDACETHARPDEPLPRAEFIQMMFKALKLTGERPTKMPYPDVDRNEFDASYAQACRARGYVDGVCYRPDDAITSDEAACLLSRAGAPLPLAPGRGEMRRWEAIELLLRAARQEAESE